MGKQLTPMQELIDKIESNTLLGSKWKEKFLEKERQPNIHT